MRKSSIQPRYSERDKEELKFKANRVINLIRAKMETAYAIAKQSGVEPITISRLLKHEQGINSTKLVTQERLAYLFEYYEDEIVKAEQLLDEEEK